MSTHHTEREPVRVDEILTCDICGGEIHGDLFVPQKFEEDSYKPDLHFHRECWDNAGEWVYDCPSNLFEGDRDYGTYVEAVRNNKYLVFYDSGGDPCCSICDDKAGLDDLASDLDPNDDVLGVVVNRRYYEARLHVSIRYGE